jgi:hypothetical protein
LFNDPVLGPVYGSGRVSFNNNPVLVNFTGNANFGFRSGDCRVIHSSEPNFNDCGGGVCVVRTSNPDQGFIADCNNDFMPYEHDFQYKICCTPREICNDGIDNTGDGLIDCASPDCHPSTLNFDVPQRCDPHGSFPVNNQTSEYCASIDGSGNVVYSPHCMNGTNTFYCSYGRDDANTEGFCCPAGRVAIQDIDDPTKWECLEPTQCGVLPTLPCLFDYRFGGSNLTNWFGNVFSGDVDDWCVSYLPNFYNPSIIPESFDSSMACCFRVQHATGGFFYSDENVKIFGAD